jgi:hypothetical protein
MGDGRVMLKKRNKPTVPVDQGGIRGTNLLAIIDFESLSIIRI